jgi:hypothetical protein
LRHEAPPGELLDPLPVYDEESGETLEPEAVAGDIALTWHDVVESMREVLIAGTEARTAPPWSLSVPDVARPPTRHTKFLATFSRMIVVDPTQLPDLPDWYRRSRNDDRVRISRRLWLGAPHREANGTWRVPGRLRSAWLLRSIPVDLLLWPHLGAWTKLSLEPQRRVHVGRRYFAKGHRVLDALTTRLIVELRVTP